MAERIHCLCIQLFWGGGGNRSTTFLFIFSKNVLRSQTFVCAFSSLPVCKDGLVEDELTKECREKKESSGNSNGGPSFGVCACVCVCVCVCVSAYVSYNFLLQLV